MIPTPQGSTVLILSTDAVTAALLSILAELEGYTPVFAASGESPADTLSRLRPKLVLLDCDLTAARDDDLLDLARSLSVRVVVFSPGRMPDEVREFAEARQLHWFSLPIDRSTLARILRSASLAALAQLALLATLGR